MKFLLHGNAPWVSTGYGVQCRYLSERLKADGHEVAISPTYGHQGSTTTWHDIPVYFAGYEVNGNDVIHGHADHFFKGDREAGWIIPIVDVWCMKSPLLAEYQVAAWAPVDQFPAPFDVIEFFHRTGAVPIAMSKFGLDEFQRAGLDPVYIPLSVDTKAFKRTPSIPHQGRDMPAREIFKIPESAFVVGMVAMNKGWARDRKGFNEAFRAFGAFWQKHNEAVLFLHSETFGAAEGIRLDELAIACGIPQHALIFSDQYAYRAGFSDELMAAAYTAMDVLLSPSHGEGFCVPLIEAQACGTPVIATDFSAQRELVGDPIRIRWELDGITATGKTDRTTGWLVDGQPEWNPPHKASYVCPYIPSILTALELSYAADRAAMGEAAREFAGQYDTDLVFDTYWRPFLKTLEPPPLPEPKEAIPVGPGAVAVIVPVLNRPQNVAPLVESFNKYSEGANLYFVADADDVSEREAIEAAGLKPGLVALGHPGTYAEKANAAFACTTEPWVLVVGDDVEFHEGWIDACRAVSSTADVIGTNDSLPGRVRNPDVAEGRHADHFLVRRSYVEEEGSSLDGAGVLMPEAYRHWFTDKEVVGLARARGVFVPCLDSVVEHHHPGYDGREDLRQADGTYMLAVASSDDDRKTWLSRLPLIEMQRVSRAK